MQAYLYQDMYELEDTHWWHIAKRRTCVQLLQKFVPTVNPRILDIGCGTGKNVETFGEIGSAWGVDISAEAIAFCRKRGLTTICLEPAARTGFEAQSFDVVTLLDVLEHTEESPTLQEASRLLKPGGILLITVPAYQWVWSQWDVALHHLRRYNKPTLTQAVEQHGFRVLKLSYMYSFLLVPVFLVRIIKSRLFPSVEYPSDFKLSTPLVNRVFGLISRMEAVLLHHASVPFGLSLVLVAQNNCGGVS